MGTQRLARIECSSPTGGPAPSGRLENLWRRVYRDQALKEQGGKCCYCHEPLNRRTATADHVTPVRRGGTTTKENIHAACYPCNQAKGAMTERRFKTLLRNPPDDAHINLRIAAFRFRLWRRVDLAERRILAAVGL